MGGQKNTGDQVGGVDRTDVQLKGSKTSKLLGLLGGGPNEKEGSLGESLKPAGGEHYERGAPYQKGKRPGWVEERRKVNVVW